MAFEAAWGVDGAVCVARPRVDDKVSIAQLADRYPRLESRLGAAERTEGSSPRDAAALLFNRSPD